METLAYLAVGFVLLVAAVVAVVRTRDAVNLINASLRDDD